MVVCAMRWAKGVVWRRRLPRHPRRLRGHTTTQPSSIEEEGYRIVRRRASFAQAVDSTRANNALAPSRLAGGQFQAGGVGADRLGCWRARR